MNYKIVYAFRKNNTNNAKDAVLDTISEIIERNIKKEIYEQKTSYWLEQIEKYLKK